MGGTGLSLQDGPSAAVPPWPDRSLFSPIPDTGPVQAAKGTWRRAVKSLKTGPAHVTFYNVFVRAGNRVNFGRQGFCLARV